MANKYISRVTLTSPGGSLVVMEPEGLHEAPLTLARDKVFKSVLEGFDTPLTFVLNAVNFINAAKALGIDTLLTMLVEVSSDFGATFETLFQGVLDLPAISTLADPTDYKIQLGCKKDDVWVKFYNRKEIDVDVLSIVDLDNVAVAPASILDIALPTQTIRKLCRTEMWLTTDDDFVDSVLSFTVTNLIGIIDLPKNVFNEIETKYNLPTMTLPTALTPTSLLEATEPGVYDFDISIVLANGAAYNNKTPSTGAGFPVYLILNGVTLLFFTRTDFGTNGVDGRTVYTYSGSLTLKKGDYILVVADNSTTTTTFDAYIVPFDTYPQKTYFNVLAHTTFLPSSTKAIRVWESFDAITKRICGDAFHSNFLYDGCGSEFVNMLGLHLRGYDFNTKPFVTNFLAQFQAASAIWNLGLGYEAGKIVIEEVSHFFDASSNSTNLSYVNNVTRTFKADAVAKSIDIGYTKWQLTSGGSLIDDPQTQHTYSTPFKYVGQAVSVMCGWVAASLLFELTRRAIVKLSDTFDTDNDIFILAVDRSEIARVDYVSSSNLLDPASRYNKEITPGRNFLRWLTTFNIGAGQYIGRAFAFVSGLGNFLASITIATTACEPTATVTENDDIAITSDVLFGVEVLTFSGFPLSWEQYKLIRDNPNKSIGVSETGVDHVPYFIDKIDFYLFERKANFILFRNV